jgi:hypothetical protein
MIKRMVSNTEIAKLKMEEAQDNRWHIVDGSKFYAYGQVYPKK